MSEKKPDDIDSDVISAWPGTFRAGFKRGGHLAGLFHLYEGSDVSDVKMNFQNSNVICK